MLELVSAARPDLAHSQARHGLGLFETLRVEGGRIRRLERHLARLGRGAAFLGLPPPPPAGIVRAFAEARADAASLATGVLRLLAVDGQLILDLTPRTGDPEGPVAADLARSVVRFSASPLNRHKTFSYLENVLLAREAAATGHFDVVARNEAGRLTDGGRTSLLLRLEGRWLTPPVAAGALPGILREVLLEAGLVREADLEPGHLARAEALVLCNALRELVPVATFGERRDLDPGPESLGLLREAVAGGS